MTAPRVAIEVRRLFAPFIVLAVLSAALPSMASAPADDVVVAVIDTGLDADHPEFDPGQVVAWWDFTSERKPAARIDPFAQGSPLWDPDVAEPYDGHGHGTATASLVGGHNRGACGTVPKESHAPGVKLAIAKVGDANGSISGDLALAWRWASEVVHADVISFSIGGVVPTPALSAAVFDAIEGARANGTLPVILAHNGLANSGAAPYPSWANQYSSSPHAFVVSGGSRGGGTLTSTTGNLDPDVAGWSDGVCVALANAGSYGTGSGTSYATPLVAGMAASAIRDARAGGAADDPDTLEEILQRCARDTIAPYAKEGWGFLGAPEVPCILQHAGAGTTPSYRSFTGLPVNENEAYDDNVRATMRGILGEPATLRAVGTAGTPLVRTDAPVLTAAGEIGASAQAGIVEGEAYVISMPAGARLDARLQAAATLAGRPGVPDVDLALYPRDAYESGVLLSSAALARSARAAGLPEQLKWTAPADSEVVLLVLGVTVAAPTGYTLTSSHAASFEGQAVYAGTPIAP